MKKYKIIVFDMDGTLYDLEDVMAMNYKTQCDFLIEKEKLSENDVGTLFASNHIYPEMRKDSRSCTEFFERRGIDKKEWNRFREDHFNESSILKENAVSNAVLEKFLEYYTLILLTSNSRKNVRKVLSYIDVKDTNFTEIICNDFNKINGEYNKKKAFDYIVSNYNIQAEEILSIGDRFETDIKPSLIVGGDGVQIKKPVFLKRLLDDLLSDQLNSCEYYDFFGNRKKVLLLGGTGTIGMPITRRLSERPEYDVYVLCRNKKEIENAHIIIGDYSDSSTQKEILSNKWDCVIDLLWHNEKRFYNTYKNIMNITNHYILFSTAAVYADCDNPIKEDASRFWDQTNGDEKFYHLQKAQIENVIFDSKYKHWTIVRPHVTFNTNRLPLDTWEQDIWLYRFLQGKTVVLSDMMLDKMTSFSYGDDVARLIEIIVDSGRNSFSQVYNVCSDDRLTWGEVVDAISTSVEEITGKQLKLKIIPVKSKYGKLDEMLPHKADRLRCDRFLDRVLDNSKVKNVCEGDCGFTALSDDIYICLKERITEFKDPIEYWDVISIAYMDYVCKERTAIKDIRGKKNRIKYLFLRYFISYRVALCILSFAKWIKNKVNIL